MHPAMLRQFAADHIRELITQAGDARRAHEVRRAQPHRPPAHLRRSMGASGRLVRSGRSQRLGSRPVPCPAVLVPAAAHRGNGPQATPHGPQGSVSASMSCRWPRPHSRIHRAGGRRSRGAYTRAGWHFRASRLRGRFHRIYPFG